MYKMNFKNYILVTLFIIAIIIMLLEDTNFTRLIITKIISLSYLVIFLYKNIISKQAHI